MKQIEIGKKTYHLCDHIFDMNDERFILFKQTFLRIFEHIDMPNFTILFNQVIQHYNKGNNADAVIELYNFKKTLELSGLNYDAFSMCFALICMNDEEKGLSEQRKPEYMGTDYQVRKLTEMREQGLSRQTVEESVENFIATSPGQFGVFSKIMEAMKREVSDEILNPSSD